ncbi:MAG TPA: ADP-ribosylglycohydrolase family protein [Halanaerobiales bacterium]|nr:ADP-ribosylglycohydrolase family protein [Halanaerobiales bacterium]
MKKMMLGPLSEKKKRWEEMTPVPVGAARNIKNVVGDKMDDRFAGILIGLAVGDALGVSLEFKERDSYQPLTGMEGGGHFDLEPGQWTDDTSMALCLAESLLAKGFSHQDQLDKYLKWLNEGYLSSTGSCFAVGRNTMLSLKEYEESGKLPPERERAAGNGSLMRLAPVPMYYRNDFDKAVYYSGQSSLSTHNNPMAVDACRFFGALLQQALQQDRTKGVMSKEELLRGKACELELVAEVREIAEGSYRKKGRKEISSSGFVIHTLEAALWSFYRSDNFREAVLTAVNLGDDADTVGSVTGQLAGAYYGLSNIPEEWVAVLAQRGYIIELIKHLYKK